jgi:CheY-like chemotaxis protein
MKKLNQVLIIDDDEVNNLFCKIVIEHFGIAEDVHYCMSGPEAFDYLDLCINGKISIPDLILLDINMPNMGGFDFLDQYVGLGYNESMSTRISMLSSSDAKYDINKAIKYSCVIDYIVKPLSEQALERLLYKLSYPLSS